MNTCIYPGPHSQQFSSEHYIPIALGSFAGMELLEDKICTRCNTELGNRVETQFLRAGPTGFFRWLAGIKGRDGLPPSPFYQGAGGTDPIYMIGKVPEWPFELLLELEPGTENVCPLRQIIFYHQLVGYRAVPILERFRKQPNMLNEHLREQGLQDAKAVHVFGTEEEIPWVQALIESLGQQPPKEWTSVVSRQQRMELVVTVNVTEPYFRAVAKIAFHYVLKMFPELTGLEREFDGIKEFIWQGGKASRFVIQRKDQFIANFKLGYRPTNWMHILAAERSGRNIRAFAQFFAGPHSLPLPYEVRIGRDPSRIYAPPRRYAHEYIVLEASADTRPKGVMQDAQPVSHILIPKR